MIDKQYNGNVRINAFGGRYFEAAPDWDNAGLILHYDFKGQGLR
jgi:hypothetical protein